MHFSPGYPSPRHLSRGFHRPLCSGLFLYKVCPLGSHKLQYAVGEWRPCALGPWWPVAYSWENCGSVSQRVGPVRTLSGLPGCFSRVPVSA